MRPHAPERVRKITVRVACAQLAARPAHEAQAALADILRAIRQASRRKADVVVLPECSYPGYVLLDADPYLLDIPSYDEALRAIAEEASRRTIAVAFGIARRRRKGKLLNEAVFIDARGLEVSRYAKSYLWNFDRRWFAPGRALPVFDTDFGTMGMLICADGRAPEIARTMVRGGAWIILDPTAWVGSGPSYDAIHNVQADYMLRVRALENGVWIAAADKCGSEHGAVHYAGRSQIVAPDGSLAAIASSASPEILIAEVRKTAPKPFIASLSSGDRRALGSLVRLLPSRATARVRFWLGMYQSAARRRDAASALRAIGAQGAQAVIRTGARAAQVKAALRQLTGLRFVCISGSDMVAPEPARAAALRGADLLVWMRPPKHLPVFDIARTRAVENRVYVAVCAQASDAAAACLISPGGSVAGSALQGRPSGFVAALDLADARCKEVVPGTQTFADRMPHIYRWFDRSVKTRG